MAWKSTEEEGHRPPALSSRTSAQLRTSLQTRSCCWFHLPKKSAGCSFPVPQHVGVLGTAQASRTCLHRLRCSPLRQRTKGLVGQPASTHSLCDFGQILQTSPRLRFSTVECTDPPFSRNSPTASVSSGFRLTAMSARGRLKARRPGAQMPVLSITNFMTFEKLASLSCRPLNL